MEKLKSPNKENDNRKKGFTLVELIVVITILAILATIAFISFGKYNIYSRDTVRVSDINIIEKSLEIQKIILLFIIFNI